MQHPFLKYILETIEETKLNYIIIEQTLDTDNGCHNAVANTLSVVFGCKNVLIFKWSKHSYFFQEREKITFALVLAPKPRSAFNRWCDMSDIGKI
jgi:hypothetical protein